MNWKPWVFGAAMVIVGSQALPAAASTLIDQLAAEDLQTGNAPVLLDNGAFLPMPSAADALGPFAGTLQLSEVEMTTDPDTFKSRQILGKDPKIFPGVALSFVTDGGDLIPVSGDIIRAGSTGQGSSYWDMIVQPGQVWSQPSDDGWSRASFPFALMHSIEGETHNGVATFLYRDQEVTGLRFQVVQQTSPYYVEDYFTAWGQAPARFQALAKIDVDALKRRHRQAVADATEIRPWSELEAKVGASALAGFDSSIDPDEIVADGISVDGVFYLKSCPSAAGELAYCDRQRFGVWSVTKAAANAAALLHLAQKYGPDIFDAKIAAYVHEAQAYPAWKEVTFGDALNMATGLGNGSTKTDPNEIGDGELDETYPQWYEAGSAQAKIDTILKIAKVYPWGPGKVARYRDQDMFMLGVAMQRFLVAKEGPGADLWTTMANEVYGPIGIGSLPINRTLEADGAMGQPLMAFGLYPTIGDLVKIARLFSAGGVHDGVQILNSGRLADILPGSAPRGLQTGQAINSSYHKAFWHAQHRSDEGCTIWYPMMSGWGGNFVTLLPGDIQTIRIAKNWSGEESASDMSSLVQVADRLATFCPP